MFVYEKKLQYPVRIKNTNPKLASIIISQYGGPNGELGAALRYLSQRYSMPFDEQRGLLTDIGTEELGHLEMVGTIVHQLTRNLTEEQQQESSFAPYFVDHTAGVYPQAASGTPWSAATMQVMGDPISDLCENLAAEQKARSTYDNILRLSDDPDVNDVIRFLRAREVVHFQRFGNVPEQKRFEIIYALFEKIALAADDFLHQLRAFDAGQVQVENEQVGGLAFTPDELKGCGHVAGRQHFGRGIPVEKHHGKGAPHERVIIDNQVLHAIEALREQSVSTFSTGLDCTKEEVRRTSPKT